MENHFTKIKTTIENKVRSVNRLIDTLQQMDITAKEREDEYFQNENEEENEEDIGVGMLEEITDIYQVHNVTVDKDNKEWKYNTKNEIKHVDEATQTIYEEYGCPQPVTEHPIPAVMCIF